MRLHRLLGIIMLLNSRGIMKAVVKDYNDLWCSGKKFRMVYDSFS
ncbi:hypothetical protein [Clostridium tagluense]|uniref:Uncharacterized protein n=1 Tax=Clostridium tagluense TaxID=360422 RepID=A0A401UKN3_9CLOT|nr:hypothetical protein [Clostridium tagluense]GCD10106.1 hypothetical protein Ctaglu_17290 [Clostridium tagluense]